MQRWDLPSSRRTVHDNWLSPSIESWIDQEKTASWMWGRGRYDHDEEVCKRQAVTKDLTSSSKFSGSCVLTLQPLPPRERILEAAGKRWTIEPWIGRWWWRWDRSHGSTFLFLAISSSFFHGLVDPPHGKEKWAVRPKVWLVHAAVNLSFSFRTPSISWLAVS